MSTVIEKPERKSRDLDDEIARAAAKLKRLQDQRQEQIRKSRERNVKVLLELLRSEGLDEIPADQWKSRITAVKAALEEKTEAVAAAPEPSLAENA